MKTLIKSIIYCQTVPLNCLLMYVVKIVWQASLPSFNLSKSRNILFRSKCQTDIVCSAHSSIIVIGRRGNSMHVEQWQLFELHVKAIYAKHPSSCIEIIQFLEKPSQYSNKVVSYFPPIGLWDSIWTSTGSSRFQNK